MWTEDRVETLKKLWAEGLSASQIAKQLGGVTRNAVIGKVHRLGLSGRATSNRPSRARQQPAAAAAPATARPQPAQASEARESAALAKEKPLPAPAPQRRLTDVAIGDGATVLSLTEHTCKWPIGDPGEESFHFCGDRSAPGMPYCAEHARLAYQPVQARKRNDRRRDFAV
ncbi:GcrA family cell cycle regulator [Tepidicaulis sp.]|uniref:GcrA family cell cycle regulator n=1 Tax=Tepidicaulis sp. TaxID=1920809 RepID=UPI003B58C974